MAYAVLRRSGTARARHGLLPCAGLVAAAGLLLSAAWSTLSAGLGFAVTGIAVLERQQHASANPEDGASAEQNAAHHKKHTVDKKAAFNATATFESGRPERRPQEVALGPPLATCFVEFEAEGRPALEEWVMRGEQENLNAFRAWRRAGLPESAAMSLRCSPASDTTAEDSLCLQCVSHSAAPAGGPAGGLRREAMAMVQGQIISTFTDLKQCLADTPDGKGFCMSGQVVVPQA